MNSVKSVYLIKFENVGFEANVVSLITADIFGNIRNGESTAGQDKVPAVPLVENYQSAAGGTLLDELQAEITGEIETAAESLHRPDSRRLPDVLAGGGGEFVHGGYVSDGGGEGRSRAKR